MGGDPSPSVGQLKGLIRNGQLRYVLLGGGPGGGPPAGGPPPGGPGGPGGRGGGPPGANRAGSRARETWVTGHCKTVSVSASPGSSSPRGSGGQGLYDCTGAA